MRFNIYLDAPHHPTQHQRQGRVRTKMLQSLDHLDPLTSRSKFVIQVQAGASTKDSGNGCSN